MYNCQLALQGKYTDAQLMMKENDAYPKNQTMRNCRIKKCPNEQQQCANNDLRPDISL